MMKSMHKICATFLLLTTAIIQSHAAQFPNLLKDASELTSQAFQNADPGALLCVVPLLPECADSGEAVSEAVGKVVSGGQPGSFVCEYLYFTNGVVTGPLATREFQWLDATYEQLASWLTSFATMEKIPKKPAYFVMRSADYRSKEAPAVCVLTSPGKGFEFGYEMIGDDGQMSCCPYAGAVYPAPYLNSDVPENNDCTDVFFSL